MGGQASAPAGARSPAMRRRPDCRLCQSRELELAFSLTPTPPANAFVPASERGKPQAAYPLELFLCLSCRHLQLLDVLDPAALFENYVYVSGTSPVFVEHFKSYASDLLRRFSPPKDSLAVDIGSNDGTFLRFFKEAGMRVLGVDPAKSIAAEASKAGLETWPAFFTPELSRRIKAERGEARVVTANNVFAHADDLKGIVEGTRELLAPDGVFAFEVSYLADVCAKTLFDTIYHEHLAYHSLKPLLPFFKANGLELIEALRVDTHGGSLRGIAQKAGGPWKGGGSLGQLLAREAELKLDSPETFRALAARIGQRREELLAVVCDFKRQGQRLAGFGAPAKATTLLYHFGLGADVLDFIIDDSPLKQGLFSPGHHIPVLPSSALYEKKPGGLLLLAWNFAEPIMAKHKAFAQAGGRFIIPLPQVEVRGA